MSESTVQLKHYMIHFDLNAAKHLSQHDIDIIQDHVEHEMWRLAFTYGASHADRFVYQCFTEEIRTLSHPEQNQALDGSLGTSSGYKLIEPFSDTHSTTSSFSTSDNYSSQTILEGNLIPDAKALLLTPPFDFQPNRCGWWDIRLKRGTETTFVSDHFGSTVLIAIYNEDVDRFQNELQMLTTYYVLLPVASFDC